MNKQMKTVFVVLAILSTTSILSYAVQPETPSLPVLVQKILDYLEDNLQPSVDTIDTKVDDLQSTVDDIQVELENITRMETHSGNFSLTSGTQVIASYHYNEVRHVSLSFYGGLLQTDEEYVVSIRIPYPDDPYYSVSVLWITVVDGAQWHHVEFDTNHWIITGKVVSSSELAGGYYATSTFVEYIAP